MNHWFRSWHGAPTDPKWLAIAQRTQTNAGMVSALAWALFDHASQAEDRGDISGFDVESYAAFSGFDAEKLAAIIGAMKDKKLIQGNRLTAWEKRQPKREDGSAERAKEWRERNRTQQNATEPKIQRRGDKKEDSRAHDDFEEFWKAYPKREGSNRKSPAEKAFRSAVKAGTDATVIVSAARKFAQREATNVGTRFIPMATTWLNQKGWEECLPDPNEQATIAANAEFMRSKGYTWNGEKWERAA